MGAGGEPKTRGAVLGRRLFLGFYVTFIAAFALWNLLSVLAVHFGFHDKKQLHFEGPLISERADKPTELLRCHRDIESLLLDLHRETFSLQAKALKFKFDPATEWRNWSPGWLRRWQIVGLRCRLSQLRGRGVSRAIDAMADVHKSLQELQISYTGVMDRFVESYSDRLRALKGKLRAIQTIINRKQVSPRAQSRTAPSTTPLGT